ncbi:hypothetical protein EDB19DRAFT_1833983 [Suillus lakei]|nr:hypothetical protein EDB19DRAFT_1833983 [Suillus lakei]
MRAICNFGTSADRGCLYSSEIVSLASDWLGNTVVQILFEKCSSVPQFAMLETITPHLVVNGIHNGTWAAQKIFEHAQIPKEVRPIVQNLRVYALPFLLDRFGNCGSDPDSVVAHSFCE